VGWGEPAEVKDCFRKLKANAETINGKGACHQLVATEKVEKRGSKK